MSEQSTSFDANNADAQSMRTWMQAGLDSYLKEHLDPWAFRPFEHYIGVRDDLAEDLRAIYQDLTPDVQGLWRSAIRDILAMQGRDPSKGSATRVLIDLAALVRAHEVLDVLPALLVGTDSFLHQVVRTAVALASQTDSARACLERIRTSPSFSPDYAGLVLRALCHVDPDGWLDHVENLAPPMNVLAERLEDDSTALRFYAKTILDAISLSRLRSADLNRLGDIADSTWLLNEWFRGPRSLLRYKPDAGSGPRLLLRADSTVSVKLNEPLPPVFAQHNSTDDVVAAVLIHAGQQETWVAGYEDGRLTELVRMDSYAAAIDWIKEYTNKRMQTHMQDRWYKTLASQLAELSPSVGITFRSSSDATPPWVGPIDALVDKRNIKTATQRIQLVKPYRKLVPGTHRRTAMRSPRASEAVAGTFLLARTNNKSDVASFPAA